MSRASRVSRAKTVRWTCSFVMCKTPAHQCRWDALTTTWFTFFRATGLSCSESLPSQRQSATGRKSLDAPKGSFDCTNWGVFVDSCADVCELADVVSGYITFCEGCVIPHKSVEVYANNKPWVTKKIKNIINMKKKAFLGKDVHGLKRVQKESKCEIKNGKEEYKEKIEDNFKCNYRKRVWEGVNLMSGNKGKRGGAKDKNITTAEGVNDLNDFYARFDCHDFSETRNNIMDRLINTPAEEKGEGISTSEAEVLRQITDDDDTYYRQTNSLIAIKITCS